MIDVYLLIDTRPEVIAAGFPRGIPFYCGMTKQDSRDLNKAIRQNAIANPMRQRSQMIMLCEGDLRIQIVQVVADRMGHAARSQWRSWIRNNFPRNDTISRTIPRSHLSGAHRKMIGDSLRRKHNVRARKHNITAPPY